MNPMYEIFHKPTKTFMKHGELNKLFSIDEKVFYTVTKTKIGLANILKMEKLSFAGALILFITWQSLCNAK